MKKTLFILLFLALSEALNAQCLSGGTLLFKEDFGGNNVFDPAVRPTGIWQVVGYEYTPTGNLAVPGHYRICKEGYSNGGNWQIMDDHTYPNDFTRGYFMQADGNNDLSGQFYTYRIDNLCEGVKLSFSLWLANVSTGTYYANPNQTINIERTNGTILQSIETGNVPYAVNGNDWHQYGTTFTIPSGVSSIVLRIKNNVTNITGNDFCLDDIEVRLCAPEVTLTLANQTICQGETLNINGNFANDGTFTEPLAYRWLFSATNDSNIDNWTAVGSTQTLSIANVTTANAGYYRLAVSSSGSINSKNCRAMSDAVKVDVTVCEDICIDGTLLFKEDFGGNDPTDPAVRPTGIPQVVGYEYTPTGVVAVAGCYRICKEGYSNGGNWQIMDDHTYPNDFTRGYFMQVDGNNDLSGQFYTYRIDNLCEGVKLSFSLWLANVSTGTYYANPNQTINIERTDGTILQSIETGNVPYAVNGNDWHQYGTTFTIPSGVSSIVLRIKNNVTNITGNDFCLDDIEVRLCAPSVTVNSTNISLCAGEPLNVSGSFVNDGTFTEPLAYRWLFSATNDSNIDNWTAVGNTQNLSIANVTTSNAGYYRLAVSSSGSINSKNCRAMSDAVKVDVTVCEDICTDGTLLFKEDFGGNDPTDPAVRPTGISQVIGYTYRPTGSIAIPGSYRFSKQSQLYAPYWTVLMDDHTYPNDITRGYFMEIDGNSDINGQFYERQIDGLCAGTKLSFLMYVANRHSIMSGYNAINPNLTIIVERTNGTVLKSFSTGDVPSALNPNDWHQYGTTLTIPAGVTSVIFRIKNNVTAATGNDFALDDIEVRLCAPSVTINLTNISLCAGEPLNVSGSFVNDGTFIEPLAYRWLFSATNDSNIDNWTAVGNTQNLSIANVTTSNAGYYRLAVSSSGSINSKNCRAMSDAMQVTIKPSAAKPIIGYN